VVKFYVRNSDRIARVDVPMKLSHMRALSEEMVLSSVYARSLAKCGYFRATVRSCTRGGSQLNYWRLSIRVV